MDRSRRTRLAIVAALVLGALGGCQHYWSKPNGTKEMFWQDSSECARTAAPNPTAAAHGIVNDQLYRACLSAKGWTRAEHPNPPPPGWYRGIE